MFCKRPFYKIRNFILYFVSLLLTSPSFCYFLDYSAHFRLLQFTSAFGLSYLRMFLTILVYVTFYLRTISDSRMFVVTILTWSIQNTVSVLWNLLVCCVATIHKKASNCASKFSCRSLKARFGSAKISFAIFLSQANWRSAPNSKRTWSTSRANGSGSRYGTRLARRDSEPSPSRITAVQSELSSCTTYHVASRSTTSRHGCRRSGNTPRTMSSWCWSATRVTGRLNVS